MPDSPLPMSDVVECDLPCVQCGYNLRTQSLSATCPECGAAVRTGLPPDERLFIRGMAPEAARAHAWRNWRLLMAIVLVIPVVLTGAMAWFHGPIMIPFAGINGAVLMAWFGWSFWRLSQRFTRGIYVVGRDEVLWRLPGVREVRVRRDEVSRIDLDSYDITVRAATGGRYVEIPRPVEHFDLVHQHLAQWHAVTPPQTALRVAGIMIVNVAWLLALLALLALCATENAIKITLIGLGGVGIGVYLIRAELRSQTSGPVRRWVGAGIIGTMLLFIFARIAIAWLVELRRL